jgi:hypothetical protein
VTCAKKIKFGAKNNDFDKNIVYLFYMGHKSYLFYKTVKTNIDCGDVHAKK